MKDIKEIVENIFEDIRNDLSTKNVTIKFVLEFEVPETPVGYDSWQNHKGGLEIDWDSNWESDVFSRMGSETSYIIANGKKYEIFDLEFLTRGFSSGPRGSAYYDGECTCIIEMLIDEDPEILKKSTIEINSRWLPTIETEVFNLEIEEID